MSVSIALAEHKTAIKALEEKIEDVCDSFDLDKDDEFGEELEQLKTTSTNLEAELVIKQVIKKKETQDATATNTRTSS